MNNPQIIVKNAPFKHFCMSIGAIPTSYLDTLDYYETLLWLIKYLEETIIPTVNNNGEAVSELQTLYIQLKDFVENYFANLDVQEEINNKLDEMVEGGELQEIISTYLNSIAVFGFNTVSDMQNASNLINGSYARTMGYYNKNDGLSFLYSIRNRTFDDVIDNFNLIPISNNLVAQRINTSNKIANILDYKTFTTNATYNGIDFIDWLPAFQKAQSDGVKYIYVPSGTYNLSNTFIITNNMGILGGGIHDTNIKLMGKDDNTSSVIEIYQSHYSSLQNINITSDKTNVTNIPCGVYVHYSTNVYLDNIRIKDIDGDGLYIQFTSKSKASYDSKITNCEVANCNGHGYNLGATDLYIANCIAHSVKKHGFYFTRSNSLLVNCKAYFTGESGNENTGDGYYMETENFSSSDPSYVGHKTRLVNCEAQECGRYGFTLINTDSCQLVNCQCDSNGRYCENIVAYGYYLENNRNLKLIGSVVNQNLNGWIKNPLYFNDGINNSIYITAQVLEYGNTYYKFFDDLYTIESYNPSNEIYINNNQVNVPDYYSKLYEFDSLTNIANGWTYDVAGGSTGSATFDYESKSQKLSLFYNSSSTLDNNVKIYKEFTFTGNNFSKLSASVLAKNNNFNTKAMLRIRFYNESTVIKTSTKAIADYGDDRNNKQLSWETFIINTEIPENTTKIRVDLFTYLVQTGITEQSGGIAWFKDFKLCCY